MGWLEILQNGMRKTAGKVLVTLGDGTKTMVEEGMIPPGSRREMKIDMPGEESVKAAPTSGNLPKWEETRPAKARLGTEPVRPPKAFGFPHHPPGLRLPFPQRVLEGGSKKGIGQAIRQFGRRAIVGGAAVGGIYGGFHAIQRIRERAATQGNFDRMMKATPTLHAESPALVESRFQTLQRMAPNLAADPLVAGSIVRQWVEYPTVNAAALKDVVSVEKDVRRELGLLGVLPKLMGHADVD